MRKLLCLPLLAVLTTACAFAGPAEETRKERILANLEELYPQLAGMSPVMGEIEPTGIPGLDQGSFTIGGRQTQLFHVTSDDKKLWMIAGQPVDVSKSREEISAAREAKLKAETAEAETRSAALEQGAAGLPFRGAKDAPVTIVEFSDFQCPYCSRGAELVEQLLAKHPGEVKFVFRHRPLEDIHPWAKTAAIAAACVADQQPDAFWTLHDAYFRNQKSLNAGNLASKTREFLTGTGIDLEKFAQCSENTASPEHKKAVAAIAADVEFGTKMGAGGTPAFFVDGHFVNGIAPLEHFEQLLAQAKAAAQAGPG